MARSKAAPKSPQPPIPNNHWTVQRSGAGLSVAITDPHGRVLRKFTSVERIAATPEGRIMAHFRNGEALDLAQV